MNPSKQSGSMMHFKSAQIAGVELSPNDMVQINKYALSPLAPEEVFAFKVSMAANEIDRDYEVFPRHTLSKLASLFVGKTVVKDHDHRSDNQIARIYATDLVESNHMHLTKGGEIFTELIAKCYMVKTSTNADLISEIRAGIRKEVSLGCRIGKAVCSICETDNVKTYCVHFPGKQYDGETCYFSLEDASDAYELSFVAIPAQQHAGTVKSYGKEPCYKAEMEAREKALQSAREILRPCKAASEGAEQAVSEQIPQEAAYVVENVTNTGESGAEMLGNDQETHGNAPTEPVNEPVHEETSQEVPVQESLEEQEEPDRLTVNREEEGSEEPGENEDPEESDEELQDEPDESIAVKKELTLDQLWEAAKRLLAHPITEEEGRMVSDQLDELKSRLIINRKTEEPEADSPNEDSENTEALKKKQAEARLRALNLSLSLRKRNLKHQ